MLGVWIEVGELLVTLRTVKTRYCSPRDAGFFFQGSVTAN